MVKHTNRLSVETLEVRDVPTTWSVPWDDPTHITVSFAPDGTTVHGYHSKLFADMKSDGYSTTTEWETVVAKALNTWANAADVHFSLVGDQGLPLGVQGAVQGDIRFGDIRIASRPLSSNLAAMASPFTNTGSTWSGDIVLNSNAQFSSNGTPGTYDLYSVILHEVGHSLGLDDSSDPTSAMNESYATHAGLSPADVQAVQSLYGAPLQSGSTTFSLPSGADTIKAPKANQAQLAAMYGQYSGKLTKSDTVDTYNVTAPAATSTAPMNLLVYVRAKNASHDVAPQLSVYNAANQAVPFEVISNESGWISVQVRNVIPGATYQLGVFDSQLDKHTFNYGMSFEFNQDPPIQRNIIAANSLDDTKTIDTSSLNLSVSRLVSFSLCSTQNSVMNVLMRVKDSTGKVVLQLTSGPNALPPTAEVFLNAGSYTITYRAMRIPGDTTQSVQYVSMIDTLNDPVGTYAPANTTTTTTTNNTQCTVPPDYTATGPINPNISPMYLYYY